jgi:branched-chain amino acid transport system ATP-binding protein
MGPSVLPEEPAAEALPPPGFLDPAAGRRGRGLAAPPLSRPAPSAAANDAEPARPPKEAGRRLAWRRPGGRLRGRPETRAATLAARDLSVHFSGLKAIDSVDLELGRGEILGLIGPNGAGKTTLVNALTGFQRPTRGRVLLGDEDITDAPAHVLPRLGIVRTFQSGHSFRDLTVLENVEVGAVGIGASRTEAQARAVAALQAADLEHRAGLDASALSHGEERRLQVARAVAMAPAFLLIDEPAAGLNEVETDRLMAAIEKLRTELECGILLIEHDMRVIMGTCDRIHVLDHGRTLAVGAPAEVRANPTVIAAYLGSGGA